MKLSNKHTAELIKKSVYEIDPKAEIIIYGSKARGNDNEDSDWDILILTDYPVDFETESKFISKLYLLEVELNEVFQVFVYSKNDWNTKLKITPFYDNVINEGIHI